MSEKNEINCENVERKKYLIKINKNIDKIYSNLNEDIKITEKNKEIKKCNIDLPNILKEGIENEKNHKSLQEVEDVEFKSLNEMTEDEVEKKSFEELQGVKEEFNHSKERAEVEMKVDLISEEDNVVENAESKKITKSLEKLNESVKELKGEKKRITRKTEYNKEKKNFAKKVVFKREKTSLAKKAELMKREKSFNELVESVIDLEKQERDKNVEGSTNINGGLKSPKEIEPTKKYKSLKVQSNDSMKESNISFKKNVIVEVDTERKDICGSNKLKPERKDRSIWDVADIHIEQIASMVKERNLKQNVVIEDNPKWRIDLLGTKEVIKKSKQNLKENEESGCEREINEMIVVNIEQHDLPKEINDVDSKIISRTKIEFNKTKIFFEENIYHEEKEVDRIQINGLKNEKEVLCEEVKTNKMVSSLGHNKQALIEERDFKDEILGRDKTNIIKEVNAFKNKKRYKISVKTEKERSTDSDVQLEKIQRNLNSDVVSKVDKRNLRKNVDIDIETRDEDLETFNVMNKINIIEDTDFPENNKCFGRKEKSYNKRNSQIIKENVNILKNNCEKNNRTNKIKGSIEEIKGFNVRKRKLSINNEVNERIKYFRKTKNNLKGIESLESFEETKNIQNEEIVVESPCETNLKEMSIKDKKDITRNKINRTYKTNTDGITKSDNKAKNIKMIPGLVRRNANLTNITKLHKKEKSFRDDEKQNIKEINSMKNGKFRRIVRKYRSVKVKKNDANSLKEKKESQKQNKFETIIGKKSIQKKIRYKRKNSNIESDIVLNKNDLTVTEESKCREKDGISLKESKSFSSVDNKIVALLDNTENERSISKDNLKEFKQSKIQKPAMKSKGHLLRKKKIKHDITITRILGKAKRKRNLKKMEIKSPKEIIEKKSIDLKESKKYIKNIKCTQKENQKEGIKTIKTILNETKVLEKLKPHKKEREKVKSIYVNRKKDKQIMKFTDSNTSKENTDEVYNEEKHSFSDIKSSEKVCSYSRKAKNLKENENGLEEHQNYEYRKKSTRNIKSPKRYMDSFRGTKRSINDLNEENSKYTKYSKKKKIQLQLKISSEKSKKIVCKLKDNEKIDSETDDDFKNTEIIKVRKIQQSTKSLIKKVKIKSIKDDTSTTLSECKILSNSESDIVYSLRSRINYTEETHRKTSISSEVAEKTFTEKYTETSSIEDIEEFNLKNNDLLNTKNIWEPETKMNDILIEYLAELEKIENTKKVSKELIPIFSNNETADVFQENVLGNQTDINEYTNFNIDLYKEIKDETMTETCSKYCSDIDFQDEYVEKENKITKNHSLVEETISIINNPIKFQKELNNKYLDGILKENISKENFFEIDKIIQQNKTNPLLEEKVKLITIPINQKIQLPSKKKIMTDVINNNMGNIPTIYISKNKISTNKDNKKINDINLICKNKFDINQQNKNDKIINEKCVNIANKIKLLNNDKIDLLELESLKENKNILQKSILLESFPKVEEEKNRNGEIDLIFNNNETHTQLYYDYSNINLEKLFEEALDIINNESKLLDLVNEKMESPKYRNEESIEEDKRSGISLMINNDIDNENDSVSILSYEMTPYGNCSTNENLINNISVNDESTKERNTNVLSHVVLDSEGLKSYNENFDEKSKSGNDEKVERHSEDKVYNAIEDKIYHCNEHDEMSIKEIKNDIEKEIRNNEQNINEDEPQLIQDIFQVEKVLDMRIDNDKRFFFLKWEGFPDSENSWEPETNLDCPLLIEEYLNDQRKLRTRKPDKKYKRFSPIIESPLPELKKIKALPKHTSKSWVLEKLADDVKITEPIVRPRGFSKGREAEVILGSGIVNDELNFLIKWKNVDMAHLVPARRANIECPQTVIRFYESNLTWQNLDGSITTTPDEKIKIIEETEEEKRTKSRCMQNHYRSTSICQDVLSKMSSPDGTINSINTPIIPSISQTNNSADFSLSFHHMSHKFSRTIPLSQEVIDDDDELKYDFLNMLRIPNLSQDIFQLPPPIIESLNNPSMNSLQVTEVPSSPSYSLGSQYSDEVLRSKINGNTPFHIFRNKFSPKSNIYSSQLFPKPKLVYSDHIYYPETAPNKPISYQQLMQDSPNTTPLISTMKSSCNIQPKSQANLQYTLPSLARNFSSFTYLGTEQNNQNISRNFPESQTSLANYHQIMPPNQSSFYNLEYLQKYPSKQYNDQLSRKIRLDVGKQQYLENHQHQFPNINQQNPSVIIFQNQQAPHQYQYIMKDDLHYLDQCVINTDTFSLQSSLNQTLYSSLSPRKIKEFFIPSENSHISTVAVSKIPAEVHSKVQLLRDSSLNLGEFL